MTDINDGERRADDLTLVGNTLWGRRRADLAGLRPSAENIIIHEGKTGVFTPIVDNIVDDTSSTEQVLLALRRELLSVKQENLQLKQKMKDMEVLQKRTPDDFASAVSHSLDSLQTRLSQMKNPLSNFAVREMSIEAQVQVDVTPLGTIDYRFVQPGDDVPAHLLSKINLTLSPVPKSVEAATWTQADFTPMHDVADIQGIGETYRKKLQQRNIYTVSDLLNAGTRARARVELESVLGVDRERMADWLAHAELLTVKELDGRNAEILHEISVKSLDDLAGQEAVALVGSYNAQVEKRGQASHKPISEDQAARWIKAAKLYVGKRTPPATDSGANNPSP